MTNYESLKKSEIDLRNLFFEFYDHVILIQNKILNHFKSNLVFDQTFLNEIKELELNSNNYEAQIMDESCWIISKDSPKANHLRFIIAILNSIKDLERMSDYMLYITKYFFYHQNLPQVIYNLIVDSFEKSTLVTKEYLSLLRQKNQLNYYDKALLLEAEYQKIHNAIMVRTAKLLVGDDAIQINEYFPGAIIVLKNIERNVDHSINIVENFVYIKQSEFFYDKNKTPGEK